MRYFGGSKTTLKPRIENQGEIYNSTINFMRKRKKKERERNLSLILLQDFTVQAVQTRIKFYPLKATVKSFQ